LQAERPRLSPRKIAERLAAQGYTAAWRGPYTGMSDRCGQWAGLKALAPHSLRIAGKPPSCARGGRWQAAHVALGQVRPAQKPRAPGRGTIAGRLRLSGGCLLYRET
jgi:hypothetical protein